MIVCLAGMHRSGTSLFSSFLNSAGLDMGENLQKPGHGNKYGHFEDQSFLAFHKKYLYDNSLNMYQLDAQLHPDNKYKDEAEKIFETRNSLKTNWGWKDPRSTFFLNFWNDTIPDLKFIFLYRNPYLVIDSLLRRKGERFFYFKPLMAVDAWINYNESIVKFYDNNAKKCIILDIEKINSDPDIHIKKIQEFLGIEIMARYSSVYDRKYMAKNASKISEMYQPVIKYFRSDRIKQTLDKIIQRERE